MQQRQKSKVPELAAQLKQYIPEGIENTLTSRSFKAKNFAVLRLDFKVRKQRIIRPRLSNIRGN